MDLRFVEICERTYRPSMNQAPILVSKPQSMPNQGCCWGTHGSPFHPRRAGIFKDCFKTCNAQTATYQIIRLEHTAVFQTSSLNLGQNFRWFHLHCQQNSYLQRLILFLLSLGTQNMHYHDLIYWRQSLRNIEILNCNLQWLYSWVWLRRHVLKN